MKLTTNLYGDRISLKPICENSVTSKYVGWLKDPDVNQFLETRFAEWTLSDIQKYICLINDSKDELILGIYFESNHIGNIKIGPIHQIHRTGALSLFIGDKSHWRKGFATEAVKLFVDYAFKHMNVQKIYAGMYASNLGSLRAFLNTGFFLEGIFKDHYKDASGTRTDVFQVGLCLENYKQNIK